jgi:hypothetical protein
VERLEYHALDYGAVMGKFDRGMISSVGGRFWAGRRPLIGPSADMPKLNGTVPDNHNGSAPGRVTSESSRRARQGSLSAHGHSLLR